jgi:putative acetyltransferase
MIIREESGADWLGITEVNEQAFERPAEAQLMNALRDRGSVNLSLVATVDEIVVGHILFSPLEIRSPEGSLEIMATGLSPLAVLPAFQRQKIGSQLCVAGIDICRERDFDVIFVLGHPFYYPRFGFKQAAEYGFACQWEVPADAFMLIELKPGVLADLSGVVYYQPEFDGV